MAQPGNYTPLSLYYSATASTAPLAANLVAGELALNTNDGKLYYKDSAGVVQVLATKASSSGSFGALTATSITDSGLTSGRVTYATTGGLLTDSANFVFDGTNVGIGTSSPTDNLYISRSTNAAGGISVVNTNNAQASQIAQLYLQGGDNAYAQIKLQANSVNSSIRGNNDGSLAFLNSTTERMRIDSSGRLLVGTTSASGANLLQVSSDASISGLTVGKGGGAVAQNTAIGVSALSANTASGSRNTAVGNAALSSNTDGSYNTGVGQYAIGGNTTGSYNTGYGAFALNSNTTASGNTAVGYQARYSNTTGEYSEGIGAYALYSNTTGTRNTAVGTSALYGNTTGNYNIAMGNGALQSNTTASNNTAVGYQAGYSNTTGYNCVAVGYQALLSNTTAERNVAIGKFALKSNTTGNVNTAVGDEALRDNTTGVSNVALGTAAMMVNNGNNNTALGYTTLFSNTSGSNNVAVGKEALQANTTASRNTAVGYQAGYNVTSAGDSTYIGYQAGINVQTGVGNTYVGAYVGYNSSGSYNTFIGGASNAAGYSMTTGSRNTIIGGFTGNQNSLDIRTASNYIVLSDGDGNPRGIFDSNGAFLIGNTVEANWTTTAGFVARTTGSTTITRSSAQPLFVNRLSTDGTLVDLMKNGSTSGTISVSGSTVAYNTSSDYRLKDNIAPLTGALKKVAQLKPVTYTWKEDNSAADGFIAHELAQVCPQAVHGEKDAVDEEGKPVYQGIDTSFLVATLTAAIQEQQTLIVDLQARLAKAGL
jgi:hypothetical protein